MIQIFKKYIEKIPSLKFYTQFKFLVGSLSVCLISYLIFIQFSILDYKLDILTFLIKRLVLLLVVFILMERFQDKIKYFNSEMQIFEEGPENKSKFLIFLRKWHYILLIFIVLTHSLAILYAVDGPAISFLFGTLSFILSLLYLYQFVCYVKPYIYQSRITYKQNISQSKLTIWTLASQIPVLKVVIICFECSKCVVSLCLAVESLYKLTHGGFNEVSPIRQAFLNRQFPDDKTKIWTESKAVSVLDDRAFGNPSDYELKENKIISKKE